MNVQDQALLIGSQIIKTVAGLTTLRATIAAINNTYTELNLAAVFDAMPTATQNADGSLTPDTAAPVAGHPIDTSKMSGLSIALSAYDIGVMLTLLQQLAALLDGDTVAQQTTAPSSLAKATNG